MTKTIIKRRTDHVHEKVSGVDERGHGVAAVLKVGQCIGRLAEKHGAPPFAQEEHVGEHLVQRVARLVQDGDDVDSFFSQSAEGKDEVEGSGAVQARSGL